MTNVELLLLVALVCCLIVLPLQLRLVKPVQKAVAILYTENKFPKEFSFSFYYLLHLLVEEHFPSVNF